jgi:uncharacterized damage-inducible protein DinB
VKQPARDALLLLVDEAYDHKSWHGTNLRGSITRVDPDQVVFRPGRGRHSIWELVVHAAYWKYAVRRRLRREARGSFALQGSNWFGRPDTFDLQAWKGDCALLATEHRALRAAVAALTDRDLARKAAGGQSTVGWLVRGAAAHDLYHAGQIQLLKRLAGPTRVTNPR